MIVRESENEELICIEQHEHARISGHFAMQWMEDCFLGLPLKPSVEFAVENHDVAWKSLDQALMYLPSDQALASFINYPLAEKIEAYRKGILQLQEIDTYAAFLVSRHYASFFEGKTDLLGRKFFEEELERQHRLLDTFDESGIDVAITERKFHFDLLQLCDNLSLYVCMNRWGATKEEEINWFKNGFAQKLSPFKNKVFSATWESEGQISLDPFPFKSREVDVFIRYKRIKKQDSNKPDIQKIYNNTDYEYHPVTVKNMLS